MKAPTVVVMVSLSLAPAFAFAASGNVHGSPHGRPSGTANSSGLMTGASARPTQSRSGLAGAGGGSGARFNALSHGRGYITRAEARQEDPLLYRHFKRCDTLRDGRITRTEFKNCRGGQGK